MEFLAHCVMRGRITGEKTDRGYLRSRMVSALMLLRAEDSHRARDKWSYVLLAEELRCVVAEPRKGAAELFRRMCFNALISNTDDHPRNQAILAKQRDWELAPAYDLTPTNPVGLERRDLAMICGDAGRYANAGNLVSQSARFLLEQDQTKMIVSEMERNTSNRPGMRSPDRRGFPKKIVNTSPALSFIPGSDCNDTGQTMSPCIRSI